MKTKFTIVGGGHRVLFGIGMLLAAGLAVVQLGGACIDEPPLTAPLPEEGETVDVLLDGQVVGAAQFTPAFRDVSNSTAVLQAAQSGTVMLDLGDEPEAPFEPGNVILAEGPDGPILGRVAAIRPPDVVFAGTAGEVVAVDMEEVELSDVFDLLEIHVRDYSVGVIEPEEPSMALSAVLIEDNEEVRVRGFYDVDVDVDVDFDLELKTFLGIPHGIKNIEFVVTPALTAELGVETEIKQAFANQHFERALGEKTLKSICFEIAGLPLACIKFKLKPAVGLEGESDAPGDIIAAGSFDAAWSTGLRCPDCEFINEFAAGPSAELDYDVDGLAQLRPYGSARLAASLEVLTKCIFELELGLETALDVRSEPSSGPSFPIGPCGGILPVGVERVRYDVAAAAEGLIAGKICFGLYEDSKSFDLFELDLFGSCHTYGETVIGP